MAGVPTQLYVCSPYTYSFQAFAHNCIVECLLVELYSDENIVLHAACTLLKVKIKTIIVKQASFHCTVMYVGGGMYTSPEQKSVTVSFYGGSVTVLT